MIRSTKACSPQRLVGPRSVRLKPVKVTTGVDARPTAESTNSIEAATASSVDNPAGGACPFLAALPTPPPAAHPWWQRLQALMDPAAFQAAALGSHTAVTIPAQLGLPDAIMVGTGEMGKAVFAGEASGLTLQGLGGGSFGRLMGSKSLLMVPEPRHKFLRALIMPAFSDRAIEAMSDRMEVVIGRHLAGWESQPGPVSGVEELPSMNFDFIIAVILGRDYAAAELQELRHHYKAWMAGILAWPFIDLPWTRYGRALAARGRLVALLQAEIDEGRARLAQGRQASGMLGSFLTAVDDDGNRLTDEEITDNLLLLLLAGHDTTSTTLINILARLQQHPEVMQRLREEQQQLVARLGPELHGAALREMPYADAVIKESLRLAGVVSGLTRKAAKDFQLGEFRIPAGSLVMVPLVLLAARDPRWAADPLDAAAFRPERQLGTDAAASKASWAMPFGHGPRFCAGYPVAMAEMRMFLALLARHYDFTADIATTWVNRIGPMPTNGLPLAVTRRC